MRRVGKRLGRAAALAALVLLPFGAQAEQVTLNPDEMRVAATHALQVNDNQMALGLAQALLRRDPDDGFALITQSRAARNLGQNQLARSSARAAWDTAQSEGDRYAAALTMAQALASSGHRTRAQLWLRRASQHAPNERLAAVVARDYRYVRSQNPWVTHLSFGIAPSSNINNGSKSDTMVIGGLPFVLNGAAQALSGVEYSYEAQTRYRFHASPHLILHVGAAVEGRRYTLSDKSKRQAPGLKASDLAYSAAQMSFGGKLRQEKGGPVNFELTLGQSTYGGAHLADFGRIDLSKAYAIGKQSRLHVSLGAEEQWRKDRTDRSSTAFSGAVGWSRRLTGGDTLHLSLGLRDVQSDSGSIAHSARTASIGYSLAKPVMGARLGLNLSYEVRDYDEAVFNNTPREDDKIAIGATAVLPKMDYYGFAPEIGLSYVRNASSEALYDSEDVNLTLGFRSAF